MGYPVVHFEVVGKDGEALRRYYSELFGWDVQVDNELGYGVVSRENNLSPEEIGIGGGIGQGPAGYEGHLTFYIGVPDVEEALAKAESLGGTRVMGPDAPMEGLELGLFTDPEGHLVGVVRSTT
jgi:predicted enzyme related to lactoylglutathione lyase